MNACSDELGAPIHVAVLKGHKEVVDILIHHKASLGLRNKNLGTPMHCAYFGGSVAMVKSITEASTSPPEPDDIWATVSLDFMKILASDTLSKAPDLRQWERDTQGRILAPCLPMFLACQRPNLLQQWPSFSIDRGCWHKRMSISLGPRARSRLPLESQGYQTLLMWAGRHLEPSLIGYLLEAGASPDTQDAAGNTAVHHILQVSEEARINESCGCLEQLLKAGARLDIRAPDGYTALMQAVTSFLAPSCSRIVKLLLENDASVDAVDANGWSVLHLALQFEAHADVIQCLLEHGADPTARNGERGLSPLVMAVQRGAPASIILALLKHGATLPSTDHYEVEQVQHVNQHLRYLYVDCKIELPATVSAWELLRVL